MRSYSVSARGLASVQVRGQNWIQALGSGLAQMGRDADVQRLACEVLQNGTVIARDITSGTGFIVQEVDEAATVDEETDEVPSLDASELEELELLPMDAIDALEDDTPDPLEAIVDADTPRTAAILALDVARDRIPAESGAVILEEGGYLRFTAVSGPHARKLVGVRLPLGTGVAGFAMEKRRAVILQNAHDDPRHCGEVDALTGYETKAIAVIPVVEGDQVLGVLELMNLDDGQRFSEEDVDYLEEVAGALAERLTR